MVRRILRLSGSSASLALMLCHGHAAAQTVEPLVVTDAGSDAEGRDGDGGQPQGSILSLPTSVDGRPTVDVSIAVRGLAVVGVQTASLAEALEGRANEAILSQLRSRSGLITPSELEPLGVRLTLNDSSLVIEIVLFPEARSAQDFTLRSGPRVDGALAVDAAPWSAGLTGSLQYLQSSGAFGRSSTNLDLSGFVNVGGYEGVYLLYGGTVGISGAERRFQRDRVLAFHDDPERALRYAAGDLFPLLPRQLGDVQLAGVSIERNYQEIQPLRNVRPTGQRTFRVERPSRVEIYSNGALLRTIDVQPGVVDLRSLPAINTTSNISIVVEDSFGRREIDAFTLTSELELLAENLSEFNLSVGVLRDDDFGSFDYDTSSPAAAGFYRRGLTERLTLGAHFAASLDTQNVGTDAAIVALGGLLVTSATASHSDAGPGGALVVQYRGDPLRLEERGGQLNLQVEARSRDFRNLGTFIGDLIKFDGFAEYRFDLSERYAMSLGANYFDRYDEPGSTRAFFLGLQANFGRAFVTATARYAQQPGGQDDSGVLFTLSMPLGRSHSLSASADSGSQRARLEFRKRRDFGIPEFDYSGFVQTTPTGEETGGRARFANSRFELEGTASQLFGDGPDSRFVSLRAQAGIAVADGVVALGRDPGRGFAIVKRNPSLKEALLDIYGQGSNRRIAQANGLGPGVVPQISPYRPDIVRASVLGDFPYVDIGTGLYETQPGAATGHVIRIGSEAATAGLAIFLRPDGTPLAAKFGSAQRTDGSAVEQIFTTSDGRAFLTNLTPGSYIVSFAEGRYTGELIVPDGAEGQVDLGTIRLVEK